MKHLTGKHLFVAIATLLGTTSSDAGVWTVRQSGGDLQAVGTGVWMTNHLIDASDDGLKLLAAVVSDQHFTSISGAPAISFDVTWRPSYIGEAAPSVAYGTFLMEGNISGPRGSSGSIVSAGGVTLLSALGTDGKYKNLYSQTISAPLILCKDGSAIGSICIPLDLLSTVGGATVRERASFVSVSDSMTPAANSGLKFVRRSRFRNESITVYAPEINGQSRVRGM